MLTVHALRIELGKSYRVAVDLLSEMPGVLEQTGLTRLPHYTMLRTWFERIPTATWRALLTTAVRARGRWLEFREMPLKATVYNLRRTVRYP